MKKGTKVGWFLQGGSQSGSGEVISDEENGHVLVAVNSLRGESPENLGYHPVIRCAVTWLNVLAPAPATPPAKVN